MFLSRGLIGLFRNKDGMAAIEFAFVLPVMLTLFCGTFEIANAVIVYMKVIDVADAVSDLVAQQKTITSSSMSDYYTAGQLVMSPSPGSGLGLAVASVTFAPNTGNPSVAWQVTRGGAAAMADAASAATGLGSAGDSVIVAKASYTYTSALSYVVRSGINLSARVFSRPRLVTQIPCTSPCS